MQANCGQMFDEFLDGRYARTRLPSFGLQEDATVLGVRSANGKLDRCSLFSIRAACWHISSAEDVTDKPSLLARRLVLFDELKDQYRKFAKEASREHESGYPASR